MSKKIKELEKYTEASLALAHFKEKNKKLFEQFDALLIAAGEAEEKLKKFVKSDIKGNIANEFIKVTYSPTFKKYYDAEVVLKLTTPKMKKAIEEAGAIVKQIDAVKFEDLVEKGEVPVSIRQEAFREVEQAPRISIKEVK